MTKRKHRRGERGGYRGRRIPRMTTSSTSSYRPQAGALESAVKMLASLPEKKALVYFRQRVSRTASTTRRNCAHRQTPPSAANVAFYRWMRGPGGHGSIGRRHASLAGAARAGTRAVRSATRRKTSGAAGNAYTLASDTGEGAAGPERPGAGHRAGAERHFELITFWVTTAPTRRSIGRYRRIQGAD